MIRIIIKFIRPILLIITITAIFLIFTSETNNSSIGTNNPSKNAAANIFQELNQPVHTGNYSNQNRILILATSRKSQQIAQFVKIAQWSRFKFNFVRIQPSVDKRINLANAHTSFYSVVIFESVELFKSIEHKQFVHSLVQECLKFKIGLVFLDHRPIYDVQECKLNVKVTDFFKTTKLNAQANFLLQPSTQTSEFREEEVENGEPVLLCDRHKQVILKNNGAGLRFVIMNIKLENVLCSLILDVIEYSSYGRVTIGLERVIQIDIDDVFVGASGLRLRPDDVHALIQFQSYLNRYVFNASVEKFKFNLGFSGFHYLSGNKDENSADQLLLEKRNHFNWFDHTWSHFKPQHLNSSQLKEQLYFNFFFAQEHGLPANTFYAVSPHHSGVYPVSNSLYELWARIWMIKVTSTEEYPHLRPAHLRRGFVHKKIMVLPRQTCGIFTHTNFFTTYPKGIANLLSKLYGGEIFQSVLFNRINIFMTHMTNYGNDRLALFVFKNLFKFLIKRTNLKFSFKPALQLAIDYFNFHKDEVQPTWTSPCIDRHHMAIWSPNKTCQSFPKLIILGPQKTGTTAVHHFLDAHPSFASNRNTQHHFEETQFFLTEYHNGIDWYLDLFQSNSSLINFEKSANYFSDARVPHRIRKLFSNIKFVIITIDPIDRAYSWYNHMKAHKDSIALQYTFYEILNLSPLNGSHWRRIEKFRHRCLDPGIYIKHLSRWLRFFARDQFLLIDGEEFKQRPHLAMNSIQLFMNSSRFFDYKNLLVYSAKKRFFCLKNRRCLGPSKGRTYARLDQRSYIYLRDFYQKSNAQLANFLNKNLFSMPSWLEKYL
ncbi:bifunctional heparan sulfate N-deacetylase N-sulfotransferase 1 [Brachionus plicatilis]|uniref:[heparan sulfate]-glucosamine N-sulfotransferase n=1 Tax=Brachionus plicatilis TaxID=10195 RepID=A0A3M7RP96_BRAPC|nr:bifunctional heparan sulfate N-deacetylase N-sulfotransferase 1 [Brachionus plicatilis]